MSQTCKGMTDLRKTPCQTKWRLFLVTALILAVIGLGSLALAQTETPSPYSPIASSSRSPAQSQSPLPAYSLAPYEERLAAARSVKVMTSILDLELGSTLEQAHAKLDRLTDPKHPPKTEREGSKNNEESEQKVLWQLAKTDYSFVFVKSDENERITSINAFLRPGKEIPFEKIGEAKKAPVQDANTIAWDVLRPNHPLFRVVANGADRKASSITIFVVKRAGHDRAEEQR
jgi:hypothetical protein